MEFIIEQIALEEVQEKGKEKFNSNNHWMDNDSEMPKDYQEFGESCNLRHWINKIRTNYKIVLVDSVEDIKMLRKINQLYLQTGRLSPIYQEELDDLTSKYQNKYSKHFQDLEETSISAGGYFVRSENVSLKNGKHGIVPYSSMKQIFESSVTCPTEHSPLSVPLTEPIRFYLFPWLTFHKFKEFRVFVHQREITAISQQSLYHSNELLRAIPDDSERNQLITHWMEMILRCYEKELKEKIDHLENFTMDMMILDDGSEATEEGKGSEREIEEEEEEQEQEQVYLIEINPFGKLYAAGSSLFHWILDDEKLCPPQKKTAEGEHEKRVVYFRYCI
jgi:hypothetical protein